MEYDMLEKLFKFLKDHAKVAVTLALTGIGAVTLAYQNGCHVEYAPEPPSAQTAPASP
jgi:hypothetical protein